MAATGMLYHWVSAYGTSRSIDVNFRPAFAVAQTSLSAVSGEGLHNIGITGFRFRPTPNGPEEQVNFGWDTIVGFPPSVHHENMSSITASLSLGSGQQSTGTLNVWFFA